MSTNEQKTPEKLTTKNNEVTSVRVPQFSPPSNRNESQPNIRSDSLTRKEKDAERKRLRRANETPEQREQRNEKKRLDARRKRSSESSDASLERLTKQRMIDTNRRNNETAEQHQSRLDQQNASNIARRSNETTEQHRSRLDQQRETDIARRSNETAEQHQSRLDQQNVSNIARRSNETAEQHRSRLDQQRETDIARRSNETAEQHQSRLDQQNASNIARRNNETSEQHRSRLDQQRKTDIARRSNETAEETTARIRSVSRRRQQRTMEIRNNPSAKTWPAAISQKVKDQCLINFNKKMSMDSLREQVCVVCNSRHNEKTMHKMLLSDIDDSLLKSHHSLCEIIPEIRTINSQQQDFHRENIFIDKDDQAGSSRKNASYSVLNGRILYREGLIQCENEVDFDCRMCHECWLAISKGKISKYSPANGMWIGDVPDELKGLTIPEQKLISLYRHNSCIIKLHSPWHSPSTAQPALKGNCITFPQNVSNIATSLPLSPNELAASIKIIFIGSTKPSRHHLRKVLTVRRQRILDALNWLKKHNTLYSHVSLNNNIITALPDDDVPESLWETLDHIEDATNANAEREGYTEDPLNNEQAIDEETSYNIIPLNPSGVLDVNGASIAAEDLNNQMLHKLRIDSNNQNSNFSEANTDDDTVHMIPRGSVPSNEYNNPTLLLGLYPTLFPYGTGAFEDASRPVKISFKKQIQYLLSYNDRRFEEHHSFIFIVFNMLQRREACLHARLMTSKPYFSKIADQIVSLDAKDVQQVLNNIEQNKTNVKSHNPQVNALLSQVKAVGGKVMGSAHSRSALRNQIHSLIFNQGLPSIFLTINPADINSRVALYFAGVDLDLDAIIPNNLPGTYKRAEIIASHPVATAKFFHRLITTVLETMIAGEKVLGPVKGYFGTVESQGRGSLHLHMLIWLDHDYTPAQLREKIKDEQFRNNLKDYLEDIISEDIDHL